MEEKSVIKDFLFNGNAFERIKQTKNYKKYLDIVIENQENLFTAINNDKTILNLYNKYDDAISRLHHEECTIFYETAFRFGVLLGLDLAGLIKQE